jgi:mono/diheme cytochrome c family protein
MLIMVPLITACQGGYRSENAGLCPQPRDTEFAPAAVASQTNPLQVTAENLAEGKQLYNSGVQPVACVQCHGSKGNGNGRMAHMFNPAPRNFTCHETVAGIPEGQYYWIIKNGSYGTSMPAFDKLSDEQIWQLTMYVRSFASGKDEKQQSASQSNTGT